MKKMFVLELSDNRLNYIKNELNIQGYLAVGLSEAYKFFSSYDEINYIFPPNFPIERHINKIKKGSNIYLFTISPDIRNALEKLKTKIFFLQNDENYKLENNKISAEGALGRIITETDLCLRDMKILLIGFGGLGYEVVKAFLPHTENITISTTKSENSVYEKTNLKAQSHQVTESLLNKYDLIINTVPFKVFKAINLKDNSYYFELASNNFPISECDCIKNNAKYFLLNALPSKTAYKSAGKALMKCILKEKQ